MRIPTAWFPSYSVLLALLALAVSGCGSAQHAQIPGVSVDEKDFNITVPGTLRAGEATLTVHNHGPDRHELIVARVSETAPALRTDGLTVDEEALEKAEVGALEPGEPGSVRELSLKLAPGRYLFFCNMAGHFLGGMHHEVVVQ
jgi:hypothetical protein